MNVCLADVVKTCMSPMHHAGPVEFAVYKADTNELLLLLELKKHLGRTQQLQVLSYCAFILPRAFGSDST